MSHRDKENKNKLDLNSDGALQHGEHNQAEIESSSVVESSGESKIQATSTGAAANLEYSADNEVGNDIKGAKKDKQKKHKQKDKPEKTTGSSRGIETMFRTAYKAQLDMISLGATKANIMISINGFLATVLMVSGMFIYATDPLFLPPAIVFLATAAISIFFAIQAASPGHYNKDVTLKKRPSLDDFFNRKANFLIFEHYASLPKSSYIQGMEKIMKEPTQVYQSMIDYLYWLGIIANWNSRMLRYSYLVFRLGIMSGIALLVAIQVYVYLSTKPEEGIGIDEVTNQLAQFESIYLPSGMDPLHDGRLLITEEDAQHALHLVRLLDDGTTQENIVLDAFLLKTLNIQIQELEGITVDDEKFIYAITSHSRGTDGRRIPEKERLIRFKIENNRIIGQRSFDKLGDYMEAGGLINENAKISIGGLAFDPAGKELIVAFRKPVVDGKALIMVIENPREIFNTNAEEVRIADKTVALDLDGVGIVSISYDPFLGGYLITSDPNKEDGDNDSQLWFWLGGPSDVPRAITLPGMIDIKQIEGISAVQVAGHKRLMIISDGDKDNNEAAHFMLLEYDRLIFE